MPDIEPRTASVATLISEIDNGRVAETVDLNLTELVAPRQLVIPTIGRKPAS